MITEVLCTSSGCPATYLVWWRWGGSTQLNLAMRLNNAVKSCHHDYCPIAELIIAHVGSLCTLLLEYRCTWAVIKPLCCKEFYSVLFAVYFSLFQLYFFLTGQIIAVVGIPPGQYSSKNAFGIPNPDAMRDVVVDHYFCTLQITT